MVSLSWLSVSHTHLLLSVRYFFREYMALVSVYGAMSVESFFFSQLYTLTVSYVFTQLQLLLDLFVLGQLCKFAEPFPQKCQGDKQT